MVWKVRLFLLILCMAPVFCIAQKPNDDHVTRPFSDFWNTLFRDYTTDFLRYDSVTYHELCSEYSLSPSHPENQRKYSTIGMLHTLMTSSAASNCATSGVLAIPYFWHWTSDMPRNGIIWTRTNTALSLIATHQRRPNYRSYAHMDRTPDIFWENLLTETPSFYTPACDSFYTFGWCSEREMAYQSLLSILPFHNKDRQGLSYGRVFSQHAHSYSIVTALMYKTDGTTQWFEVEVDNTFNRITWVASTVERIATKKYNYGSTKQSTWYNRMAKSNTTLTYLKRLSVSPRVQARIRNQLAFFFRTNR